MISIVMAYHNRQAVLKRTLDTIHANSERIDYEVVIVNDGSPKIHPEIFPNDRIRVIDIEKKYPNSCIAYNVGFEEAKGDIIIIQNPECMHMGSVLETAKYTGKNYLSFSCFSIDRETTKNFDPDVVLEYDIPTESDGENGWYNHPVHKPNNFHFCTSISRKNLMQIGFFDERYKNGIAFEDSEFRDRVQKELKIVNVTHPYVIHQWHEPNPWRSRDDLIEVNKALYYKLKRQEI